VLVRKWRLVPGWQQLLSDQSKPLGFWRRLVTALYNITLPLGL
jgi:hypothetical protein